MPTRIPTLVDNGHRTSARAISSQIEAGSFRDPESAVFYADGQILRGLTVRGAAEWAAVGGTGLVERLIAQRKLVTTREAFGIAPASFRIDWVAVLEHDEVPFVSYPFEWCFGMLRDAAILHLEILIESINHGVTMKDGHAYNVQWWGSRPTFIDVMSFTTLTGGPWPGYRQFCETFLNPLFLQAHRGVDFQPWLRGRLGGIPVGDMLRLLSARDLARRGVLRHVVAHGLMDRWATGPSQATQRAMAEAGFGAEVANAAAAGLLKLVRSLSWRSRRSAWSTYGVDKPYSDEDLARKAAFVESAVVSGRARTVWDLGCNDGTYSRVAARAADYVVAIDADHPTVDRLYRALRADGNEKVLPLVMDLADPSPGLGWRNAERQALLDRDPPELVLCLALVHHLAIRSNVPMGEIVAWLRSFGCRVLVEFVGRDDPMVQRMLADKPIDHPEYRIEAFESYLAGCFRIERREPLTSGTRTLYLAAPR